MGAKVNQNAHATGDIRYREVEMARMYRNVARMYRKNQVARMYVD